MPDANDTVPRWARRRAEATIRQGRHFVSAGALLLTCPALTGVFVRASLSNQGGQPALLAHPQALVLEEDNVARRADRVATCSDVIVGFATIGFVDGFLALQDLHVDPDWMRHGKGRQRVRDAAAATAAARGIERIVLEATRTLARSPTPVVSSPTGRFKPVSGQHLECTLSS